MNILLVSMMVPDAPSGVRVHYQRLAAELRWQGHVVTILTPGSVRLWQSRCWGALRRVLDLGGPLGRHLGGELHGCANIYTALDRRASYDVVNAQDTTTGWLMRHLLGPSVPIVVTGHFNEHPGLEVVRQLNMEEGWAARMVMRWHNFFLARTDRFISISSDMRHRVAPFLPSHARHLVVHNGLDLAKFGAVAADPELQARAAGRHVLLNIGYLEKRKNQLFMLEVAAELRTLRTDFVVALVGQGPDEKLLRARIAMAGLQDCVWLLGHRTTVASLLRASTLYVHSAIHENFALVLLEAMACDVPVLAMGVGAVPEVLGHDAEALFAPTATPAAVAQRLHQLLENSTARVQLQQRQRNHLAQFDISTMLAGTVAAYEEARRAKTPAAVLPA